ncbi:putative alcohol dehydrogenase [Ceratobasidium sp. AG-I]|nr:putative alcohol dehydrogenase [Ceratobasidium sp. AG-I]
MAQHKAALLLEKQGKIEVGTRTTPTPKGKEVLVKVTATAINPVDWKIAEYGIYIDEFPAVLGTDGAGIVEALGPEVTHLKKGDKIFFQGLFKPADWGTFQQYTLVDSEIVSKIPDNISDNKASTVPLGSMTSVTGLFQKTGIDFPENGPTATGRPVLILGGSSSVGQYAIQLARIAGFSPIVTTASAQHTEFLKSLGATHVFDRDVSVKTIQDAFPTPVALAFDTIGAASTQLLAFEALTTPSPAPGAHLALVLDLNATVKEKNADDKVSVHRVFGSSHLFKDLGVPLYKSVGKWIEEGKYVPNRVHLVEGGLAGVPEALSLSKKGVSGEKLVIRPQE